MFLPRRAAQERERAGRVHLRLPLGQIRPPVLQDPPEPLPGVHQAVRLQPLPQAADSQEGLLGERAVEGWQSANVPPAERNCKLMLRFVESVPAPHLWVEPTETKLGECQTASLSANYRQASGVTMTAVVRFMFPIVKPNE